MNKGTVTVTKVLQLSATDVIRIESRKSTGSATLQTSVNGSTLLIEKL